MLTPGQRHDSKPVPELLDGLEAKALLADKAYDSDKIVQAAQKRGMQVIIPSRVNRKKQRVLDRHHYKARHLVESVDALCLPIEVGELAAQDEQQVTRRSDLAA
ncbi:hypothetical protein Pnap_4820 (plasmid) [Polaromonas naphthalenivorans CJ2]|uniref:Transposase IS4-like domain-containing protein n=1 Tax=Polaromonas naphthalenivorans (strain CJ2) TaxID=365044 RepID=A1VW57_POLNA|nr:hypothetical protein Pnap_4820 [Polaromonas naphthalenivorans CJ2]